MIKYNPIFTSDGQPNGALVQAPSDSIVFDLPGRCIWVKGVQLKGTDHTYTFSNDNYITLTNTPGNPEDIKIGVNITTLKPAIDTTYNAGTLELLGQGTDLENRVWAAKVLADYVNGLMPSTQNMTINGTSYAIYTSESSLPTFFAPTTLGTAGQILACTSAGLTWTNQVINTDYQVQQAPTTSDANYRILFKHSANDNIQTGTTYFASTLLYNPDSKVLTINGNKVITVADTYVGATSTTNATAGLVPAATSAQRNYFLRGDGTWQTIIQENTWRPIKVGNTDALGSGTDTGTLTFAAGTGISLGWDATNKKITITNSKPDVNHNTDHRRAFYGTCDTAAAIAAKVVTLSNTTGWELVAGTIIGVKFTNSNSAQNVTLAVNGDTAKSIFYNNAIYTGTSADICGNTGRLTYYMYDGTNWVYISNSYIINTTYSAMSLNELTTGTATTSRVITAKVLNDWLHTKAHTITGPWIFNTSSEHLQIAVGDKQLSSTNPIGQGKGDIHFYTDHCGSGNALTDGNVASITFGHSAGEHAQAGIYVVTSGSYGTKIILGTTDSYANGVSYNTIIDNKGYITSSGFKKYNSDDTYVLLGGGGHKLVSDFATSGHVHSLSIAVDSGTNQLTLAASKKYKLTAGGSTFIFTTPPNTWVANAVNTAGYVAAPTATNNKYNVWMTDGDGVPAWRNATTSAVLANAANSTTQLTTEQANPFYNLLFGGSVARSVQFVAGEGVTVRTTDGSDIKITNVAPVYYIKGNADTTAGTWTGTDSRISAYYEGLTIIFVPQIAGASTTTLNINGLGAKTCYFTNTSKLTTHYAVGTPIMLTYYANTWRRADYDSNSWRAIRINSASSNSVGTGTGTKAINFASNNLTINYLAAGTSTGQSGSADYFTIGIEAKNWTGATNSANGTTGYMPAPTSAQRGQFLRGDGTWVSLNNYSLPTASSTTLGGIKVGSTLAISSSVLNLPTTGVTAGTYRSVTVDAYGRVTAGDNTDSNTWRNIYVDGTQKMTIATDSKALNFKAGSNVTLSYLAPGTTGGDTDSGSNNYGTIVINATNQIPSNNITGSGTNGYITKWTGTNTIGNMIAINAAVSNQTTSTKFLREDGTWAAPSYIANTDEKVKQTPKTDNNNRPLMMINGGTTAGEQTNTSMFSTGIYANASSKTITSNGFIKTSSDDTYVLLGGGGHKKVSNFATSAHTHTISLATDTGTATVNLAHATTYKLTAGGSSIIFKTPSDNNTDTKVSQSETTTANWRPILVGYTNVDTPHADLTTAVTNVSYVSNNISFQPSTGSLSVKGNIFVRNSSSVTKLELRADSEGGNIRIYNPTQTYYTNTSGTTAINFWEIDSYNGNLRFYNYYGGDATHASSIKTITFGRNGSITSPDIVYANAHVSYNQTGYISSSSGTPWPNLKFDSRAGGSTYVTINQSEWGDIYFQIPAKRTSDNYYYRTRFFFRQYSRNDSGARLGYYEDYYLPETNNNRDSSISYSILTTKNTYVSSGKGYINGTEITQVNNANYANYANLLYPTHPDTTTTSRSTWNIPSGCRQVWGQKFSDNTLKYTPSGGSATTITDTGDWTIWLAPSATSNSASLNMRIDGTYYGAFSGNLSGNASTATEFSSNATVTLTGDTTGTSAGSKKSWTVPTITKYVSCLGRRTTAAQIKLNPSVDTGFRMTWHISDSTSRTNDSTNSPSFDCSIINLPWDWGGYIGQIALGSTGTTRMQIRSAGSVDNGASANPRYTPSYGAWREVVTAAKATQIGSSSTPVYISNTGQATACSFSSSDFVLKSGDTMTGDLSRKSSHNLAAANNNVSSTIYPTTFNILDNQNRISVRLENIVTTTTNAFYLYAKSYDSGGTSRAQRGLKYTLTKPDASNNVTGTWAIDDAASFRSAISVYSKSEVYTRTEADDRYVNVTGDLMSGSLTMTNNAQINIRMNVNTSNAKSYSWQNTSGTTIAQLCYHNTAQNIILNPIGSADIWSDAVGKYSLFIGNNKLTYNTYKIWHEGNDGHGSGLDADTVDGYHASSLLKHGDVIDTHGEGENIIVLDNGNELGGFYQRGGTCTAYEVASSTTNFTPVTLTRTGTSVSTLPAGVFNGLIGYAGGSYSGSGFAVYDLVLPETYSYGSNFFWSFGNATWKPAKMRVLVAKDSGTYIQMYSTDSCPAYGKVSIGNGATGYNRLRIVVSSYSRLSCFGTRYYASTGLNMTYMNRCQDDAVWRSITPAKNNAYYLGGSSNGWAAVYATHFYETSDISKKTNIQSLSEHIRKFTMKSDGREAYGVIAQEVPEMFRSGEEGSYSVNYSSILSYYVGLLENRVAQLEKEIKELKSKNK